jgi:hypothetical protein
VDCTTFEFTAGSLKNLFAIMSIYSIAERSLPLLHLVEMLSQPRAQLLLSRGR